MYCLKRIFLLCALLTGFRVAAELVIPKLSNPPGGKADASEVCWSGLQWHELTSPDGMPKSRFKVGHDQYHLYFLVEADEPMADRMKGRYPETNIWRDECVEFFLALPGDSSRYFQVIVNPSARMFEAELRDNNTGQGIYVANHDWKYRGNVRVERGAGRWTVELSIPFAALGMGVKGTGALCVNVSRQRYIGGRHEIAAYRLPKDGRLGNPAIFQRVGLDSFDATIFSMIPGDMKFRVRMEKGVPVLRLEGGLSRTVPAGMIIRMQLRLDGCGTELSSPVVKEWLAGGGTAKFALECILPEMGEYRYVLRVFRNNPDRQPLCYVAGSGDFRFSPVTITVLEPSYRNNIYAGMRIGEIIARVKVEDGYEMPEVELSGPEGFKRSARADAKGILRFPTAGMPDGEYVLSAPGAETVKINKLPRLDGEVWLDADGITYVNGEKFLPFGWYSCPLERHPERNIIVDYVQFSDVAAARAWLDRAQAAGIKAVIYPYQEYRRDWKNVVFDPAGRRNGRLDDEQRKMLRTFVDGVKDHPGLLGWYLADEPEGHGNNPLWYKDVYTFIRGLDPYHPCFMTNYGLRGIKLFYEACDILMPDCYPNYVSGGPSLEPMSMASEQIRLAAGLKPSWLIPQAFCWERKDRPDVTCRPPEFIELRNQIYQAFCNNGKGIVLWSYLAWSRPYLPLRMGPEFLRAELEDIKDLVLAKNVPGGVAVSGSLPSFQSALKRSGGDICLIAVNTAGTPGRMTFKLDASIGVLHVKGLGRTVRLESGSFSDDFSPFETKVYLSSADAASRNNLVEFINRLDAAEKGRFKPGNLLAMGVKTLKEYQMLTRPDPKTVPLVKVSSQVRPWHVKNWGDANSLYFLFDGLADPDDEWMAWVPERDDAVPWVEIALPRPETAGRVKLCCLGNKNGVNLESGELWLNRDGNWEKTGSFSANTGTCVELKFAPRKISGLKVVATGVRRKGKALLSEIELYRD